MLQFDIVELYIPPVNSGMRRSPLHTIYRCGSFDGKLLAVISLAGCGRQYLGLFVFPVSRIPVGHLC